jgi:hypothetical protein
MDTISLKWSLNPENRAHDIAISRSHKTISAADVIKALEQLEFGDIAALMPAELEGKPKSSLNL